MIKLKCESVGPKAYVFAEKLRPYSSFLFLFSFRLRYISHQSLFSIIIIIIIFYKYILIYGQSSLSVQYKK